MRKLYTLKKWYSLDDAAKRLSLTLGEPIEVQDVRQLMADDHMDSYCNVRGVYAIEVAPASIIHGPDSDLMQLHVAFGSKPEESKRIVTLGLCEQTDKVVHLHGLFKIETKELQPVLTNKRWIAAIVDGTEHEYLTDGDVGGDVMLSGEDGKLWQLRARHDNSGKLRHPWDHPDNFYPTGELPDGTQLLVSKMEIENFEAKFSEKPSLDRPVSTTERNTLLSIIAALCDYSAIEQEGRGTAAQIATMTDEIGASVSDDTIRKILKQIPDALRSRMK